MKQLPHDTGIEDMTNIIWDTLMRNTKSPQFDCDFAENLQCEPKEGEFSFDYETEKGTKWIKVMIEVHDGDDNDDDE